jgi:SAM-dependent methyltransferase
MTYSQKLRSLFPDINLHPEDLLLLEAFQISNLPDRVPTEEFATLLRTYPVVHRFLANKQPTAVSFLERILSENEAVCDPGQVEEHCQEALWEIADLIIYNKYPERFDTQGKISWKLNEITDLTPLDGKIVADVGAGSGRIAFLAAPYAATVYAVEPVTNLRSFMRAKALKTGAGNVFVMDGTLDSIPLPDHCLDVLITSNAMGWNLNAELREVERVVRFGGRVIHLLHADEDQENPFHDMLSSSPWNYAFLQERSEDRIKTRYYKEI